MEKHRSGFDAQAKIELERLPSVLFVVCAVTSFALLATGLRTLPVGSAYAGDADVALGNVVGSNIFNVLFILGISALIAPLAVTARLVRFDVPLMIAASWPARPSAPVAARWASDASKTRSSAGVEPAQGCIAPKVWPAPSRASSLVVSRGLAWRSAKRVAAVNLVKLSGRSVASVDEAKQLLWPNGGRN